MKRIILSILLLIAGPALAETFSSPMSETGWSYSTGTATGSNVRSMKMIHEMSSLIKKDHVYDVTFTVGSYSGTGAVRAFVGVTMPSSTVGAWLDKSTVTPIADPVTMTTGNALESGVDFSVAPYNLTGPGLSIEDIGSFRIFCTHAKFGLLDPVLNPGVAGANHIHEFIGNTGVDENSTYATLRTKGGSSCQDNTNSVVAKFAVNAAAYWWPAVMDGLGHVIRENQTLVYYKGPPKPGLNYGTAPFPYGGVATASGTTLTRTSGGLFTNGSYVNGGTIYFGADNFNTVAYTISTITDGDHLTLTTSPPAGSGNYGQIPKEIYNAAANQCNDEWGGDDLTLDPNTGDAVTDETRCPMWPAGIKFIFGYNKANGQGRPDVDMDITTGDNATGAVTSGTKGIIVWQCMNGPDSPGLEAAANSLSRNSLADLMADAAADPAVCPIGSVLHFAYNGPSCWDGHHIDSPDHRAHVAYGQRSTASGWLGNQRCPAATPYPMPQMSLQNYYTIDQAFRDQKWRLSIDEMVDGLPAGIGAHSDYIFAWSPALSDMWFSKCVHPHNSCTGEFGDGTQVGPPKNYDGTTGFCNACAKSRADRYVSTKEFGMSWDYTANGTYTVRLKAAGNGVWGFMGLNGFNGTVSSVSVVEVPTGANGPVTVGGAL